MWVVLSHSAANKGLHLVGLELGIPRTSRQRAHHSSTAYPKIYIEQGDIFMLCSTNIMAMKPLNAPVLYRAHNFYKSFLYDGNELQVIGVNRGTLTEDIE